MTNKTREQTIEKIEYIQHTEQLISFWQGKLDHDDSNLISPTTRLLIHHTIQHLKKVNDMLSLGYVQKAEDQTLPECILYPHGVDMIMQHDCPLLKAGWVKVEKELK